MQISACSSDAGQKQSVAATKTFRKPLVVAALAMLAHWGRGRRFESCAGRLPEACEAALLQDWAPLADRLVRAPALYVLGRGPGYAIASEIALKIQRKPARFHAEAYSAAEVYAWPVRTG